MKRFYDFHPKKVHLSSFRVLFKKQEVKRNFPDYLRKQISLLHFF